MPLEQAYQKEENGQSMDVDEALGSVQQFVSNGRLFVARSRLGSSAASPGQCEDSQDRFDTIVAMVRFHVVLEDIVLVNDVFVKQDCRGKGFGKAIVAGGILGWKAKTDCSAAHGKTLKKAMLHVGESNTVARRTYQSLGFKQPVRKEAMHCIILD